jgi:transposase
MPLSVTAEPRTALRTGQGRRRSVRHGRHGRHGRRLQAVLLRADGVPVATVARTLNCPETSVYNWVAAWRADGRAGVAEGAHPGKARRLDPRAEAALEPLLTEGDPHAHGYGYGYAATGWPVPLLRTELAQQGGVAAARTIRRALHRRGWRWKRPKFVLGRPDPADAEKKSRR